MKSLLTLIAFIGLAKQCSKYDPYVKLDQNTHPAYVHKMELTLAEDLNSDDSATAASAKQFLEEFETGFRDYHPDKKLVGKLADEAEHIQVKVIGGNWCSDTRREVPRLCKVMYYSGIPVSAYEYYRVDKNKKPLAVDFTAGRSIGLVPEIVIFYKGKEAGSIREIPRKSIEADMLAIIDAAD